MKLFLSLFTITVLLLYLAGLKVTFKPFSISFTSGWLALAWICFIAGITCLRVQYYGDGLQRGKELLKEVMEEIKAQQVKDKA